MAKSEWNAQPFRVAYDARLAAVQAEALATESWWVDLPPVGYTQIAEAQVPRMRASKYGVPDQGLALGPMTEAAGTRLNRAKRMASGYQTLGMRI